MIGTGTEKWRQAKIRRIQKAINRRLPVSKEIAVYICVPAGTYMVRDGSHPFNQVVGNYKQAKAVLKDVLKKVKKGEW